MEHKKILLIGFGTEEDILVPKLEALSLKIRTLGPSCLKNTVGQLCLQEQSRPGEEALERGIVLFHNFNRDDLDPALKVLREAGLSNPPLKAMVTPTNWHWKVSTLLSELQQEQQIMGELMKLKKLRDSMPMPAFTDIPAMKARMQAEVQLSGGENVTVETIHAAYAELEKFLK